MARNSYTKSILIVPKLDSSKYEKEFNKLIEDMNSSFKDLSESSPLQKIYGSKENSFISGLRSSLAFSKDKSKIDIRRRQIASRAEEIGKEMQSLEGKTDGKSLKQIEILSKELKKLNDENKNLGKKDIKKENEELGKILGDKINSKISEGLDNFLDNIKDFFKSALEEFDKISSYNLGTSLRYNQTAMENAMTYGLTGGQSYAFEKTKSRMGLQGVSDEDMYNWLGMNPTAQEKFADLIGKYTAEYNKIADDKLLESYEEFNFELQSLKDDLQLSLINFIVDNKDLITSFLQLGLQGMEAIMSFISMISKKLGFGSTSTTTTSDIVGQYVTNRNSNVNVKVDNTFNGVPISDQRRYVELGEIINQQMINSLDGNLGE